MVGQRRIWNFQLFLNISDDEPFWMRGQKQLHDAQSRLCTHGRQHVGELRYLLRALLALLVSNISILAEIWVNVNLS